MIRIVLSLILLCSCATANDYAAEWGEIAYKRCVKQSTKNTPLAQCTTFQELIELIIDQQSGLMSAAVGVSASEVLERSFESKLYKRVGLEIIDDVLSWMLNKRIRDEERIEKRLQNQLNGWLLKVAAQDTNMQNVGRAPEHIQDLY